MALRHRSGAPRETLPAPAMGPVGTHDGVPFPCTSLTVHAKVDDRTATVELSYIFQNTFRDAELVFPIRELRNCLSFSWSMNDEVITGGEVEEESVAGGARVRRPLPAVSPIAADSDAARALAFVWRGEPLTDMDPGTTTHLHVRYTCWMVCEKEKHSLILPLTIFPILPEQLTLDVKMAKSICRVTSPNVPDCLYTNIWKGDPTCAECTVIDCESIRLEDHVFVVTVELGAPAASQVFDLPTVAVLVALIAILLLCAWIQSRTSLPLQH
eukprot:RCo002507